MNFYIDPGTGSMLFTILIGVFGAAFYSIKLFFVKFKSYIGGGKTEKTDKKTPFVIYSDDKRYWPIFEPICKELDKLDKEVLYLTASADDPALKAEFKNIKVECIGKGNSQFFRLNYLNASIVLSTTPGLGVYQWKRSKNVDYYVHIPHAASDITMYRMFGIDYYDAILLSGEYQVQDVRKLEKLRNLPAKDLEKVGIPYMDVMAKRLENAEPLKKSKTKTVLVAPSWGSSALLSVYGRELLAELVKTGYNIVVRPHPQSFESEKELMDKLMEEFPNSEKFEWNRDNDNFDVLRRSDIMISDFSGVIFDYTLIFGKPIIYTDPNIDDSPYDVWWLKQPFWTISVLPKIGHVLTKENMTNVKSIINECLTDTKYAQGLKEIKEETWEHFGEGAKRAVDFLARKYEEVVAKNEKKAKEDAEKEAAKVAKKSTKKSKKVVVDQKKEEQPILVVEPVAEVKPVEPVKTEVSKKPKTKTAPKTAKVQVVSKNKQSSTKTVKRVVKKSKETK